MKKLSELSAPEKLVRVSAEDMLNRDFDYDNYSAGLPADDAIDFSDAPELTKEQLATATRAWDDPIHGKYLRRIYRYAIVMEQAHGSDTYAAHVPDLPGCHATGRTEAEAKANTEQAIQEYWRGLRKKGRDIPLASARVVYAWDE